MMPLDPDVRDRLNFVVVSDPNIDLSPFPDFLLIGPQRTGTTWLHDNLCRHPQIFMPEAKEIYYFTSLEFPETHPTWMGQPSPELDWYLEYFRPAKKDLAHRKRVCRELYGERFEGTVRGEATASYAAGLSAEVIDDIVLLNPQMKVIMQVRHPIERAWSHAKKNLAKERDRRVEEVPEAEFLEFVAGYYQVVCGRYSRTIEMWKQRLGEGNLLVHRFEDVVRDPRSLLLRVFEFLGIRVDPKYVETQSKEAINPTQESPMPPAVRAALEEIFAEELEWLAANGWTWPEVRT